MKTFTKSVMMLAVVAACVSFASCGNAGAEKAIAAAEAAAAAAAAAAADTTAAAADTAAAAQ